MIRIYMANDDGRSKISKTEAIIDIVSSRNGRSITSMEVADILCLDRKVIATLLSRLAKEGRVVKITRGLYSFCERARNPRTRLKGANANPEVRWKKAFEELNTQMDLILGPAAERLREAGPGARSMDFRNRTENLIREIRSEVGGRLTLDLIQPILGSIFGDNGVEEAKRLCFPVGGGRS